MNRYAILNASGVVINIAVAHTAMEPNWVLIPSELAVTKGWTYDGETFFSGSLSNQARRISQLAFLKRLEEEEAINIDLASIGNTVEAATIRRYLSKINAAQYIDLEDSDLVSGLNALEGSGLLDPGRAAEILNNPIKPDERP